MTNIHVNKDGVQGAAFKKPYMRNLGALGIDLDEILSLIHNRMKIGGVLGRV